MASSSVSLLKLTPSKNKYGWLTLSWKVLALIFFFNSSVKALALSPRWLDSYFFSVMLYPRI